MNPAPSTAQRKRKRSGGRKSKTPSPSQIQCLMDSDPDRFLSPDTLTAKRRKTDTKTCKTSAASASSVVTNTKIVSLPTDMFEYVGPNKENSSYFKCLLPHCTLQNPVSCSSDTRYNIRRHVKVLVVY